MTISTGRDCWSKRFNRLEAIMARPVPLLPAAAAAFGAWLSRVGSRGGGPWDAATCRALTALAWSVPILASLGVAYAAFVFPCSH